MSNLKPLQDFAVFMAGCDMRTWPLLHALRRIRVVLLNTNAIPAQLGPAPRPDWRRLSPYRVANLIFRRFWPVRFNGLRPAWLRVMGGLRSEEAYRFNYRHLDGGERLWVHSLDYDLYLATRDTAQGDYAVLLDEHLAGHFEYALRGIRVPLTPARYDELMDRWLTAFEAHTGWKVVIAVHPSAGYPAGAFGGRDLVQGHTAELVAGSRAVLAHASTATGFAVLHRKPLVLLRCAELEGHPVGASMDALARELGLRPVAFDRPFQPPPLPVDEAAWAAFQERWIKRPGTPERPFWEVVGERLLTASW